MEFNVHGSVYRNNILVYNSHQNLIQEEIKSRLKSGKACHHSVQNLLSSSLISKNLKMKIYRNIILPVLCVGVKLGQ